MEFLKEYIYMILGAMGASYLIISGIINYFKKQKELEEKQKELERQKQYEQDLLLRFDRFKTQYSGLFDVNNRSLQETRLSSYFTDKEINWLVKKGCVKIEIKHVL